MKLAEIKCRQTKAADKPHKLADGGGRFLLVNPTGTKLWRWKYRFDGKEKLMSLGKYPDIGLSKAREAHRQYRAILASGIDPMAERQEVKEADQNTFKAVSQLWYEHWKVGKTQKHAAEIDEGAPDGFDVPLVGSNRLGADLSGVADGPRPQVQPMGVVALRIGGQILGASVLKSGRSRWLGLFNAFHLLKVH